MPLTAKLDRKLRAAEEDESDDLSYYEVSDRSSPSIVETGEGAEIVDSENDDSSDPGEDDEEGEEESSDDQVQQQLSKVSFGALAKAQDALTKKQSSNRKRKRGSDTADGREDKLQALRQRLQEIKAAKLAQGAPPASSKKLKTSTKAKPARDDDDDEKDSDGDSDSEDAPRARSSKHAPMKQSSKRPVSRRRDVYEVKKSLARDPRFDNAVGGRPDDTVLKSRYAFLNDYRESEMAELRAAIKKTKNEDEKEKLKRKLLSMESQKKAQQNKDKQQEIIREHRKKEKELVKQGKQPFYLKKSEQKKLALIDRFENMKAKERDKVIERRRKKASAKERKNMPAERRMG